MIYLLAGVFMFFNNVFAVLLVDAEARDHENLSGLFDSMMDLMSLLSASISITILQQHNNLAKGLVLLSITIANFLGSKFGVRLGRKYIKPQCTCCKIHPVRA